MSELEQFKKWAASVDMPDSVLPRAWMAWQASADRAQPAQRIIELEDKQPQAEAVPQPPADWEVFNTGAEVASGLTWEDASSYLTSARLARGWCAVLVVNKDNFAAQGASHE